jgi:hypothetical protein
MKAGREGGLGGFVRGIGIGVLGIAAKPVMGVTEGLASVAYGVQDQLSPSFREHKDQVRPPRALVRSPVDDSWPIIGPLNLDQAYDQAVVKRVANALKIGEDPFVASLRLPPPVRADDEADGAPTTSTTPPSSSSEKHFLLLSERRMLWLSRDPASLLASTASPLENKGMLFATYWSDVSHCTMNGTAVEVLLYQQAGSKPSQLLECSNEQDAKSVYWLLYRHARSRVGNPHNFLHPNDIFLVDDEEEGEKKKNGGGNATVGRINLSSRRNSARASAIFGAEYVYGTANKMHVSAPARSDESSLLASFRERLEPGSTCASALDMLVWTIVREWERAHGMLNRSRCLALLVINASETPVQIEEVVLKEGRDFVVFGAGGFDEDSQSLQAGGGTALVFVFAHAPSLVSKAHSKIDVRTSAFSGTLSTRVNRSSINEIRPFQAAFLEKSQAEFWSKYVVIVNDSN